MKAGNSIPSASSAELATTPPGPAKQLPLPVVLLVLAALTVAMFAHVIFTSQPLVPAPGASDLLAEFVHIRQFGFNELRDGNLPLWNPHIFSGVPYLGGFQSAMLYPPNLIFLFLPVHTAINASMMMHVFMGGIFMYLWCSHRKLHWLACIFAAAMFMFCSPFFLRLRAGHLSNICTIAWIPLLLLAIDRLFDRRTLNSCLLGAMAAAMMVLAGHAQYVFYTAVAAGIYCLLQLTRSKAKLITVAALAGMAIGAFGLSAMQLLTGMEAAGEGLRSGGVPYMIASSFSFPPESFLTLLAPSFFGDSTIVGYWGRYNLQEMILFITVTGLVMAILGLCHTDRKTRRFSLTMAVIMFVLALGDYTPLFGVLYDFVPGFDKFRGSSKFILFGSMFLIMLSACGMDWLIRTKAVSRRTLLIMSAGCCLLIVSGSVVLFGNMGKEPAPWLREVFELMGRAQVSGVRDNPRLLETASILRAGRVAGIGMYIAAATIAILAILLHLRKRSPQMVYAVAALALLEMLTFAMIHRDPADIYLARQPEFEWFTRENPGDHRSVHLESAGNPNVAMSLDTYDLWGLGPVVQKRYAEFMAFSQGRHPDNAEQAMPFIRPHKFLAMLRTKFILDIEVSQDGANISFLPATSTLGRLALIYDWRLCPTRDHAFATMRDPRFNPMQTVVLEAQPVPLPEKSALPGRARIVDESTDHMTIEADLPTAAILLVTDSYSKHWKATPLEGTSQRQYTVMPADYTLRAVPLQSGHHLFRMEYLPTGFVIGKWITIVSVIVFIGLVVYRVYPSLRKRRPRRSVSP